MNTFTRFAAVTVATIACAGVGALHVQPVASAAARPPSFGYARIGPVYTPPADRRRGYAAGVTAVAAQASACPAPLDDTERDTALARLRRALRTLGREEEALIIAERAKGNAVARRPDADAGAVLGIPDGVLEEIGL